MTWDARRRGYVTAETAAFRYTNQGWSPLGHIADSRVE